MDLPEPAVPITASVSPGWTARVSPCSTGSAARYPKVTSANSTAGAASAGSATASDASRITGLESITSNTRTTLARACWPTVSRLESIRTGPTSCAR